MKTVRRPPYPKWNPGYFPCSSLTPLPLSSRRPSVSFGGFGLTPDGDGTLLRLRHTGLPAEEGETHTQGWAHYLQRLSIAAVGQDPGPDPLASSEMG